jgi:citrate lyase subunit beta/citryl-CoA lyase
MKPLRTALFAPGSKERVMGKALESGADAVIFDLEDSVPLTAKAEARTLVAKAIAGAAASGPAVFVRTNAAPTGMLSDDLAAVVRPGLAAIFMSKAESADEIRSAAAELDRLEAAAKMPWRSVCRSPSRAVPIQAVDTRGDAVTRS